MKYKITSRFLEQESFRNHPHRGIDLKMEIGEPLRSIQNGIIHVRDYGSQNAGKTILIEGEDGRTYIYGHLSKFNVKEGQTVHAGDLIGYSGNSGHSTGAHLHFGIKENGNFIDPSPYIDKIQNMNNPSQLVQMTHEVADKVSDKISLSGMEFIKQFTANFIYCIKQIDFINLLDYFFFI